MSDEVKAQETGTRLPFDELVAAVGRNSPKFARFAWISEPDGLKCPLYQVAEREAGYREKLPEYSGVFRALIGRYSVDVMALHSFMRVVDSWRPANEVMRGVRPEYHDRVQALVDAQPGLKEAP